MLPEQNSSPLPASGKLYSRAAITLATFLGAPLAGCVLMAINYRRLGKPKSANAFLIGGALSTAVLAIGSVYIPDRVPSLLILSHGRQVKGETQVFRSFAWVGTARRAVPYFARTI